LGFVALNPTYILPVLLQNAKPNNGRFWNRARKFYQNDIDFHGVSQAFTRVLTPETSSRAGFGMQRLKDTGKPELIENLLIY